MLMSGTHGHVDASVHARGAEVVHVGVVAAVVRAVHTGPAGS